jgi:cystathionine beta-lyase/cystathionine gamma-synthase
MTYLSTAIGPIMNPFDSFLVLRNVKTLPLRMQRHCLNAQPVAEFLEKHRGIERVSCPGLESRPQYPLAGRHMAGFGAMISMVVRGGLESARQLLERTQIFPLAKSLGGVESLVRLSVGIDTLDDINNDLAAALDTLLSHALRRAETDDRRRLEGHAIEPQLSFDNAE